MPPDFLAREFYCKHRLLSTLERLLPLLSPCPPTRKIGQRSLPRINSFYKTPSAPSPPSWAALLWDRHLPEARIPEPP